MNELALSCQEEELTLLAEKALWWKCQRCVFVADVHLGKPSSFRASGVPVPEGSDRTDLERLSAIVRHTQARELCVLGDLIHNRDSLTPKVIESFAQWRLLHPHVNVSLTKGNHDRHAPKLAEALGLDACEDRFERGPFIFQHEPTASPEGYVIAGHLHPGVHLSEKRARSLKLPCCHIGSEVLTMPAFGTFTGTQRVRAQEGDRIVVFSDDSLTEVPWKLCR